jgi:hypothetical protein
MSTFPKVDHVLAGVVIAFDSDAGEVLDVNEKFVETVNGKLGYASEITSVECEDLRADVARSFTQRAIDVVIAPPETAQSEGQVPFRYHVDPKNRKVSVEPERDLISEATQGLAITPKARPKKKKSSDGWIENVRLGSEADITAAKELVRLVPSADIPGTPIPIQ